jgi:2,4-dienoyl-CoA reductase-like NADH-dependent reductase (Old Yellow Enzyme family)
LREGAIKMEYNKLFEPGTIGRYKVKYRIIMASICYILHRGKCWGRLLL